MNLPAEHARDEPAGVERGFRSLIEHASDLIVVTDRNGVISYVSPSVNRMTGYAAHEVLGRNYAEFVHPDDLASAHAAFAEVLADPAHPHTASRRLRHRNGNWIVIESIATNLLHDPQVAGIVIDSRDITKRTEAERALQRVNRAHKVLSSCNGILIRADSEMQLMQRMCDNIVGVGGYLLTWVGVVEHDPAKTVRPVAYAGYEAGFIEQAQITWADTAQGRGPVGTAIRTHKLQVVQDALTDPAFSLWRRNAAKIGYGSVLALPLIYNDNVLGVVTIYASGAGAFDAAEMQLLNELADDLAYGIFTLRTRVAQDHSEKRLRNSMEGTILAMAATLEMRDAYTAGHQRRVADLSAVIAREMGVPEHEIRGIYFAAVVHDLGKIQIPAEILSKPSRLTRIEFELIKTHPEVGFNILKEVDFPWPIAQLVYQHHERQDGSGYPRGLKAADILTGAKIIAVADTVEAMALHRPYRPGFGSDKALDEILKNRGVLYDAAAVDACVKLFRENRFAFAG